MSVVGVSGFVRPFTEEAAREHVSGGSTLVSWKMAVTRVWAVARFASDGEAKTAAAKLEGSAWPAKNGGKLRATVFASEEQAERELGGKHGEEEEEGKKEEKSKGGGGEKREREETDKTKKETEKKEEPANLKKTNTKPTIYYTHK